MNNKNKKMYLLQRAASIDVLEKQGGNIYIIIIGNIRICS